ncbi:MAG: thioredoxin family protein [Candidatus Marinimicrobia bacterium]|nr:thioredoxin family protein [Candidatus Neomarinimicrobiota bacterium]MDD5582278.1 thioredoxin family protein [Candidatus Neomarinimicrobiota bacterium]
MKHIKILGSGCPKCAKLAQRAEEAAKALRVKYSLDKVSDWKEYKKYGVMMTPALVVNEILESSGQVLSVEEIKNILSK